MPTDHPNEPLENQHLDSVTPLTAPAALKREHPITPRARSTVLSARAAIRDVLHGRDRRRLVVVVGPCSIHDPDAAVDYATRLRETAEALRGDLVIVMRAYFEKPRSTVGWKGLLNDPHLDGRCDIAHGLEVARSLLIRIGELGVPCASEALDPITPDYLADGLALASIGARTVESQTHRQMASGLSMPVGFKNGMDGSITAARDAMLAAAEAHSFLGVSHDGRAALVRTTGNPDRHLILRGGHGAPNHSRDEIREAVLLGRAIGLDRPVMVDCSHQNSRKDPARQLEVCRDVLAAVQAGEDGLMGLMIESNLKAGRQDWSPGQKPAYGVSITDACLGWDDTEPLLHEIADTVRACAERRPGHARMAVTRPEKGRRSQNWK